MPALDRPAGSGTRGLGRRAAVGRLVERPPHRATGEHRDLQLADGTQISLSTSTSIDVKFDSCQRFLHVRQGTILITTVADTQQRPFFFCTAQGTLQALAVADPGWAPVELGA